MATLSPPKKYPASSFLCLESGGEIPQKHGRFFFLVLRIGGGGGARKTRLAAEAVVDFPSGAGVGVLSSYTPVKNSELTDMILERMRGREGRKAHSGSGPENGSRFGVKGPPKKTKVLSFLVVSAPKWPWAATFVFFFMWRKWCLSWWFPDLLINPRLKDARLCHESRGKAASGISPWRWFQDHAWHDLLSNVLGTVNSKPSYGTRGSKRHPHQFKLALFSGFRRGVQNSLNLYPLSDSPIHACHRTRLFGAAFL